MLLFIRCYASEGHLCSLVGGVDAKTFRKWIWFYLDGVSSLAPSIVSKPTVIRLPRVLLLCLPSFLLQKIKLENRFKDDIGNKALMTVDGTDFRIKEPHPYSKEANKVWYSFKFKGPGLRYEVGICIRTGDIVWFNGPFPASFHDLTIFRLNLKALIPPHEKVLGDSGYEGDNRVFTAKDRVSKANGRVMGIARARHETVNGLFKDWQCLKQVWRHDRNKHVLAFRTVVVITQLGFNAGNRPFQVRNYVHLYQQGQVTLQT